jgi:glucose-6-phosphate 1-epimerase
MQLAVANDASAPLIFEEALHTYFEVGDIKATTVSGLEGVSYLDKMDDGRTKVQQGAVSVTEATDRVYLDTAATCVIHDAANKRSIHVAKENSNTTVVWSPWESGAKKLADMDDAEWQQFIAVETVNAGADTITLANGATHTMQTRISVVADTQ